jgi:hypothetical protein
MRPELNFSDLMDVIVCIGDEVSDETLKHAYFKLISSEVAI